MEKKNFQASLNLPRTDFPIRPAHLTDDAALLERWNREELYKKAFALNAGGESFILHDGPPYANGHIHLGTSYNKILKDMVTKSRRMSGYHVPVTPGWDCHGLPIELKVVQETPGLERKALRTACRAYAQRWIGVQKEEFKRLGVIMDWDNPYLTMDYQYEASTVRAFGVFVRDGFIEKKNKTVAWCASCQTVLASAEIEYAERKDPSIYVRFVLDQTTTENVFPQIDKPVSLLIWTTTPWTLPLNRAVLIKPDTNYDLIDVNGELLIVGSARTDALCTLLSVEKKVLATIKSEALQGARAHHPFINEATVPVIADQSVLLDDGTACVHSAPGCGPEDYEVGVRYGLEIFSPLSPDGKYTRGIIPEQLEGMSITDGQIWVLRRLAEKNTLVHKTSLRHSFPHCWRCRNGLMFRATQQWFCNLARATLRERAIETVGKDITMIPAKESHRFEATLGGRLEWCLSRQRAWGTPIPAVLCSTCMHAHTDTDLIEKVAQGIEKHGIEYWDSVSLEELLPADFSCKACHGTQFTKEQDILDVWFDSGVSHYAVLHNRKGLTFPADLYFEGRDQHRGWFQSSLLTGMVIEGKPPMRAIATHGYTVDGAGRKMSKSIGNVVAPHEVIEKTGTDCLRLWVSSIDFADDAVMSDVLMRNVQEVYRKIRNTCRFMLSNLYDFTMHKDAIAVDKLQSFDQYALWQLTKFDNEMRKSYEQYDFTAVFHGFADYCSKELSARYLDIVKDRLYVERADSHARRSAQTTCWYMLDTLTKLMAPVLSFAAEHISDHYQGDKKDSIHLQKFADLSALVRDITQKITAQNVGVLTALGAQDLTASDSVLAWENRWKILFLMRSALLKAIEGLREAGTVKHSLEARLVMYIDAAHNEQTQALNVLLRDIALNGQAVEAFLKEFLIVSQVELMPSAHGLAPSDFGGVWVTVEVARGTKCPRCWHFEETDHFEGLCARCAPLV